jgi:hypothetical protein
LLGKARARRNQLHEPCIKGVDSFAQVFKLIRHLRTAVPFKRDTSARRSRSLWCLILPAILTF